MLTNVHSSAAHVLQLFSWPELPFQPYYFLRCLSSLVPCSHLASTHVSDGVQPDPSSRSFAPKGLDTYRYITLCSMSPSLVVAADSEPPVKRRRLRKGTHSCWQCKKRKVKCIPDPLTDGGACDGCRRRGSRCVGQECPEDGSLPAAPTPNPDHSTPGKTSPCDQSSHRDGLAAPASTVSSCPSLAYFKTHAVGAPRFCARLPSRNVVTAHFIDCSSQLHSTENDTLEPTPGTSISGDHIQQTCQGRSETLSQFLHRSLPSREDTERICTASQHQSVLAHEIMTMPYTTIREKGLKTPETLLEIPGRDEHPILLARHMLLLASFLQRK